MDTRRVYACNKKQCEKHDSGFVRRARARRRQQLINDRERRQQQRDNLCEHAVQRRVYKLKCVAQAEGRRLSRSERSLERSRQHQYFR